MNKKLLLICTFLLCILTGVSAKDVTIDFSTMGFANGKDLDPNPVVSEGVTVAFDKGTSSNTPKYYTSGTAIRVYGGNTMKVSATGNITAIKLTFGSNDSTSKEIITDCGTYTEPDWTGSATAVVFTVDGNSGNRRVQAVTVTYDDGAAVKAPTIEGTTPFVGTTSVTLACATADAKIYYTLDGTAPTAASTEYNVPFTINATTTVKAIAVKGDDASSVTTKEFVAIPTVANVAELNALEGGSKFAFGGDATVVANPESRYLYIKDATGSSLIYNAPETLNFEVGQHITPNWTGSVTIYKNLFEAIPSSTLTAVEGQKDEVTYPEAAPSDITSANKNKVVTLKNVAFFITQEASGSAKANYEFETEGGAIVKGYDQFSKKFEQAAPYDVFDVVGAIGVFNDEVQFWPISMTRIPQPQDIELSDITSGGNLSDIVKAERASIEAEGDYVGDIYLSLVAGGTYTVTEPIVSGGSVMIMAPEGTPATIDASALTEPMIKLEGGTTPAHNADGTENANYKSVDLVGLQNIKVTGLATSLLNDAQKSLVENVTLDNSVVELVGSANVFDFKGYPATLNISNSTLWSKAGHTGCLVKTAGRVRDLDSDQAAYTESTNIANSTLYKVSAGKQLNNLQGKGQKSLAFSLKNTIVFDCTQDGNEVRGWLGGQNSSNPTVEYDNNTYWNNSAEQEGWEDETKQGADATGTAKNYLPEFTDAENGNFTVYAGSLQARYKIGDPRWLVEYDKTLARPINIDLEIEDGENITEAIADVAQYIDNIGNIDITFAPNAKCTVTAPIETKAPLHMYGDNAAPATIDASAVNGAFIQLSATPDESTKGTDNDYYHIRGYVSLSNLNINGVKGQLVYDNNVKYCVENLVIDSCNVNLKSDEATGINGNAVIYFKGGFANTLSVSNSTFWQNGTSDAKYFVQYNNSGRATRAGYENNYVIFQNNTFSNVAKAGQWANYAGFTGQKTSGFIVTDNIFSNCGNMQIARRILGGRTAASYAEDMVTFNNNTYMTKTVNEGEVIEAYENAAGYDESGTIIEMDPLFADADNGNFTVGASTKQAKLKTGDPRWLVEFVPEDVTDIKAELLAEIQKATALLGSADPETDAAAKALKEAIDKAQNVYDTSEFSEEIDDAIDDLKEAEAAFIATGINTVNSTTEDAGAWYTLQGVRVEKPSKGIFIHNGKKVVLK